MNAPRLLLLLLLLALTCAGAAAAVPGVEVSAREADAALRRLDQTLTRRDEYARRRQERIDSLQRVCAERGAAAPYAALAEAYTGFNNDSALVYLDLASRVGDDAARARAYMHMAALLPLAGMSESAETMLERVDTAALAPADRLLYYDRARQMYSYLAALFERYPLMSDTYRAHSLHMQERLLAVLEPESDERLFNEGEYAYLQGRYSRARALLSELLARRGLSDMLRARAAHHMSVIARDDGDEAARIVYLAESAMADVRSATREVTSLQELGTAMSDYGDIDRAYAYLSTALANAVACGADVRMLESARSLPYIEQAYARKTAQARSISRWVMAGMAVLMLVLVGLLIVLHREMSRLRQLQQSLRAANRTKEIYMSQFLKLCSIYMDKLKQFSKLVTRKIGAGQVDDLYRMARNGKFVEEESRDFYEVFDRAFLHIYPTFVDSVNALLRPGERIEPAEDGGLNTDLRILAFMRLGIEDTASIAQVLNYSVNTIYSYRNRLRARAISRDTFEADVMRIGSIPAGS
ncbi:MAG: hypothetical protein K2L27_06770 [Muribaculaceae bacterium]|nr:hypothetical protein [Muribaculaceae bacterium]